MAKKSRAIEQPFSKLILVTAIVCALTVALAAAAWPSVFPSRQSLERFSAEDGPTAEDPPSESSPSPSSPPPPKVKDVIANAETFSDSVLPPPPQPNQTVTVTNNIGNGGGGRHHAVASAHYAEERPHAYYYRDSPFPRLGVFDEYYSPSGYASSYYRGGPPCDDGTAPWLSGRMNLPPCSRAAGGNVTIAEALLLAQAANGGGGGGGGVNRSGGDRNATALTMAAVTATAVAVAVVSAGLLLARSR
jgi:hypothetical protein